MAVKVKSKFTELPKEQDIRVLAVLHETAHNGMVARDVVISTEVQIPSGISHSMYYVIYDEITLVKDEVNDEYIPFHQGIATIKLDEKYDKCTKFTVIEAHGEIKKGMRIIPSLGARVLWTNDKTYPKDIPVESPEEKSKKSVHIIIDALQENKDVLHRNAIISLIHELDPVFLKINKFDGTKYANRHEHKIMMGYIDDIHEKLHAIQKELGDI